LLSANLVTPKFELYSLDPITLDARLREWLLRTYAGGSLPPSTKFSSTLDRAPLDEHARRVALFGHGAWAMLERNGQPTLLAGMAGCKYDELRPGYFTLEYDGDGRLVGAGYWTRDSNGNWNPCEGGELGG
jgi:hypothetical protein